MLLPREPSDPVPAVSPASWTALTCGKIPTDQDLQCETTDGGAFVCPCPNNYCNQGWRSATASVALISALLGVVLAATW